MPGLRKVTVLAGGGPGWCPPTCAWLYKPDRWGRGRGPRETRDAGARQAGGSDDRVFCGCLAGDLLEEWIQKWLLFVRAQFREVLQLKCQAPAVPGKQDVHAAWLRPGGSEPSGTTCGTAW